MNDALSILLAAAAAAAAGACILPLYVRTGLRKILPGAEPAVVRAPALGTLPGVSVIVAARNEEQSLPACLQALAMQDYPADRLEIIVVNDRSTDGTQAVIDRYVRADVRFRPARIESLPERTSPKKQALARGIAEASHELLLFTDADCEPAPGWVRCMAAHFATGAGVVLGFSPVKKAPGPVNALDRLETYRTAALMLGFCANGNPYMSVGRNWGYRRQLYLDAGGMERILGMTSGDDDLLLQQMLSRTRVTVAACAEQPGVVKSGREETAGRYLRRKMRHFSAGARYPFRIQLALGMSQAAALLSLAGALLCGILIHPGLLLLPAAPILIQRGNLRRCMIDQERPSAADHLFALLMEPVYVLLFSLLGIAGLLIKPVWER